DRPGRRLRGATATLSFFLRDDRGGYQKLFRAGSSAPANLPFLPERSRDAGSPRFLPGPADHSTAALGMSGDVYHLVHETGGAHPSDLADVAKTIWKTSADIRFRSALIPVCAPDSGSDRARPTGVCTRLPGEESARDSAPPHLRRGRS